jgi:hypothetical protein
MLNKQIPMQATTKALHEDHGLVQLAYTPVAYEDELFYSIIARLYERMNGPDKRSFVIQVFGTDTVIAVVDLPSHLDAFIRHLREGHPYSIYILISNHTLLPIYGPFLPTDRLEQICCDMAGDNGATIHTRIGIAANRLPLPMYLRFCFICRMEDIEQYDEPCWHRLPQVAGVLVCHKHKVWLEESRILVRNTSIRYEFVSASDGTYPGIPSKLDLENVAHRILLEIAEDFAWFLEQQTLLVGPSVLQKLFKKCLFQQGLATYSGRVKVTELLDRFRSHYSEELLKLLHCELDKQIADNWLIRLVRKNSEIQSPLQNLLLIRFLGYSAKEFFNRTH